MNDVGVGDSIGFDPGFEVGDVARGADDGIPFCREGLDELILIMLVSAVILRGMLVFVGKRQLLRLTPMPREAPRTTTVDILKCCEE